MVFEISPSAQFRKLRVVRRDSAYRSYPSLRPVVYYRFRKQSVKGPSQIPPYRRSTFRSHPLTPTHTQGSQLACYTVCFSAIFLSRQNTPVPKSASNQNPF